jgi:AcrR family transcriptional regulator
MTSNVAITERQRHTADERRVDVLGAAVIEFATHGLHGSSTEAIAKRAGISQPYVLRLFGTKKALFLAAVAQVTENIMTAWRTSIVGMAEATPEERLRAMGEQYQGFVGEVNALRLVLQSFSSAEDPDIRAASHHSLKMMFEWVQQATGAPLPAIQQFFAYGMMLTVAASIRALEEADVEPWARLFVEIPIQPS